MYILVCHAGGLQVHPPVALQRVHARRPAAARRPEGPAVLLPLFVVVVISLITIVITISMIYIRILNFIMITMIVDVIIIIIIIIIIIVIITARRPEVPGKRGPA